jgi:hypothetical protein
MFDIKRRIVDFSRDTSVGMNDGLDGRGSIPGRGRDFSFL